MSRATLTALGGAGVALAWLAGCQELVPTATDASLIPIEPVTVEVLLGLDDVQGSLQVLGGFGRRSDLGQGLLANRFRGSLDARTLVRFANYPVSVSVLDTTGVTRADSSLTPLGGEIVLRVDTVRQNPQEPVTLTAAATGTAWDAVTASWEFAVDSTGLRVAWPILGAGDATPVGSAVMNLAQGDSIVIAVDSTTVSAWGDTTDVTRGLLLGVAEEGVRVVITGATLRVSVRPASNPDTTVVITAARRDLTFIMNPDPDPEPSGLRVGGAPAWRSMLTIDLPDSLRGPPDLCALVTCPLALTEERLNQAELLLTTSPADPAYRPTLDLLVDLRAVLSPERLPKSPLGGSLIGPLGQALSVALFTDTGGQTVSLPMTDFVRDLLRGETTDGHPAPNTMALLTRLEPLSIGFGSFAGPGDPGAPRIRLILTVSDNLQIP